MGWLTDKITEKIIKFVGKKMMENKDGKLYKPNPKKIRKENKGKENETWYIDLP